MALIKSISGFRGTIGGYFDSALTPLDIVAFAAGYGQWLHVQDPSPQVVIGRDGRVTGPLVQSLVVNTLLMQGIDVIDAGLSTTPTIEMAVPHLNATGGIIITASHNPMNWNALKLLNHLGEFVNHEEGQKILELAAAPRNISFAPIEQLGSYQKAEHLLQHHIEQILKLDYINLQRIAKANIHVVVDPINSSGAIAVVALLDALKVSSTLVHGDINGRFGHNPEPLAAHLVDLADAVVAQGADFGISVDPDVDRLAIVCEDGGMLGEENTLVCVSDYLLKFKSGPTVSNLSSTRALRDISRVHGQNYFAAAVGEVNVVQTMKEHGAVIGGEGNGGVILPDLHYGRDALVGIALFLSYYTAQNKTVSQIKNQLPTYYMSKKKVILSDGMNPQKLLENMARVYADHPGLNLIDGVKIDLENSWVHMRKSNTEPIIRIYTEANSEQEALDLALQYEHELLESK